MKNLITLMAMSPIFWGLYCCQVASTTNQINNSQIQTITSFKSNSAVEAIARPLTVRLLGENIAGSGVIISREGNDYFVVTCAHVIDSNQDAELTVLTADGEEYIAKTDTRFNFTDIDLAVVKFHSNNEYPIAVVNSNLNLSLGEQVYVAGFPNYDRETTNRGSTMDLGIQPYNLTQGKVSHVLNLPLERGYKIGMSNEIEIGMSGGPVLNKKGELVGIIGRAKYAFGGFDAYRFSDGSTPSEELLEELISASWAIPIYKLDRQDKHFNIINKSENRNLGKIKY
ncbi:MAG: serine protease [Microcoleaceae cyanobacterium MO_207.B10]|nr:serine protease [Microcoleaceae cyanobacterium MO_207.B10]